VTRAPVHPVGAYGDQLLSDRERARRWAAHVERQAAEEREEAEARRVAHDQFQRELARQPVRAWFPPSPAPWLGAEETLQRLLGHWRH
jgi:hypothetical protein